MDQFRIGHPQWLRLVLFVKGQVQHDDALENTDLGGRKPDAGGGVHCRQHVVHETANLGIHPLDGFRLHFQPRIGGDDDRKHGHDGV